MNFFKESFSNESAAIVVDILKYIGTLVLAGITARIFIVYNKNSKSFFKCLSKAVYPSKLGREEFKLQYKKFKNYIPHRIKKFKSDGIIDFKDFCKEIKKSNDKVIFIIGPSGIGKSTLLKQLAFKFKKNKSKNKAHGLLDYGIIYKRFNEKNIEYLFSDISKKISPVDIESVSLFLDGFDETNEMLSESVEEVFKKLNNAIFSLDSESIDKIFITLRPEIFSNGIYTLDNLNWFGGNSSIYVVERFNKKQAIDLYKKNAKLQNENSKTIKQNLERLENLMDEKNADDCIFSYPFVLEWASELFNGMSDDELKIENMYNIIGTIIHKALEREYKILMSGQMQKDAINEDECISAGKDFIKAIALAMLNNGAVSNSVINYSRVKAFSDESNSNIIDSTLNVTTRRLLKVSELTTDKETETAYTFFHNMIYWYAVADVISDVDSPFSAEDRKRYFEMFRSTLMPAMYVQALENKTKGILDFGGKTYESPKELKTVDFNNKNNPDVYVDGYFKMLPYLETVTLNGFSLDKAQTEDLIENRDLDLSESKGDVINCLECISADYLQILDVSFCDISDSEKFLKFVNSFNALKEIGVSDDIIRLDELCNGVNNTKKIELCYVLKDANELDVLQNIKEIPSKSIKFKLFEKNSFDNRYLEIYKLRKQGLPVSVWDIAHHSYNDDCSNIALSEAIYEIDKLQIEENTENKIVDFIHTAYVYTKNIQKLNQIAKIETVFDYVIDLITDESILLPDWDIKYKVLNRNKTRLFDLFMVVAESGNSLAQFYVGECFFNGWCTIIKNSSDSFKWFEKSALNGNAVGMNCLGTSYLYGRGVTLNYEKAFDCFEKSARNGNAAGMDNLALCYLNGWGVEQNKSEAFKWCEMAAKNSSVKGMMNLGTYYRYGYGTTENEKMAFYWFRKSALHGSAVGMDYLGWCYEHGYGTDKSILDAFKWYTDSAALGSSGGICDLGRCLLYGYGGEKKTATAFELFEKSAKKGNSKGMYNLAECYKNGWGTSGSEKQAFYWYLKAAFKGVARAMNCLGWCFSKGFGTKKSPTEAFEWFYRSAQDDDKYTMCTEGMVNLARCYENGYGTEKNNELAFQWYKKAADNDDITAMRAVARCYREGIGVEPDEKAAAYWEAKADEAEKKQNND